METFKMKNDLGIEFDCAIVARKRDTDFIIYTNFIQNENGDFLLFVGKWLNGKIVRVDNMIEKQILNEYINLEKYCFDKYMEEII